MLLCVSTIWISLRLLIFHRKWSIYILADSSMRLSAQPPARWEESDLIYHVLQDHISCSILAGPFSLIFASIPTGQFTGWSPAIWVLLQEPLRHILLQTPRYLCQMTPAIAQICAVSISEFQFLRGLLRGVWWMCSLRYDAMFILYSVHLFMVASVLSVRPTLYSSAHWGIYMQKMIWVWGSFAIYPVNYHIVSFTGYLLFFSSFVTENFASRLEEWHIGLCWDQATST